MTDLKTLKIYDDKASEYATLIARRNAKNPHLDAFVARLPIGGRVLDLGCGPGLSAAFMADSGLRVDALDGSAKMVAMAARHASVMARQATFDQIDGHNIYDGIWANFCLLHASREAMPRHLKALATILKPGGAFHISMKLGSGSHRDAIGRLYTYYSEAELTGLLTEADLTVTGSGYGRDTGLDGTEADWVVLTAHG